MADYKSEGGEPGKRGPGRPPKTTAGVNNTADTYTPSVERNNVDQALQPTGASTAGLGGSDISDGADAAEKEHAARAEPFGGKGDHDADGKAGGTAKFFPVLLKRNYRPVSDTNWKIVKADGSYGPPPKFEDGASPKAHAGYKIALPVEEAKTIIAKGVAERADEIG
jgi:hypothetical protein